MVLKRAIVAECTSVGMYKADVLLSVPRCRMLIQGLSFSMLTASARTQGSLDIAKRLYTGYNEVIANAYAHSIYVPRPQWHVTLPNGTLNP